MMQRENFTYLQLQDGRMLYMYLRVLDVVTEAYEMSSKLFVAGKSILRNWCLGQYMKSR